MSAPTPKFRSKEYRAVLSALEEALDPAGLKLVLLGALERRAAEHIVGKMKKKPGGPPAAPGRAKGLKREELVERLAEVFFTDDEVAFACMKELDRSCAKERHMVAETPEGEVADRMAQYPALALARERARMVWALARDERDKVRAVGTTIVTRALDDRAQLDSARTTLEGGASPEAKELARKFREQSTRLTAAAEQVSTLESKLQRFEEERAKLLAQLGAKERGLRQDREIRERLEEQQADLRTRVAELEAGEAAAKRAVEAEAEARANVEELQQRVRRLSKLASASKDLSAAQEEIDRARKESAEQERRASKLELELEANRNEAEAQQGKLRAEMEAMREELHAARRRILDLERRIPHESEESAVEPGSVALLLDQANLAATASMVYRRKVNFASLLDRLVDGRVRRKAIAFVVDNGGSNFDGFCESLRRAGWELRIKKPKVFTDGTTKADWDMGLAVEAVEMRGKVETVVLGSGDGDFAPLVKLLKRYGLRVEVAAFPEGLAIDLGNVVDAVRHLGSESLE